MGARGGIASPSPRPRQARQHLRATRRAGRLVGKPAGDARQRIRPADASAPAPVAPRLERVTRTSAMTNWPALSSDARLVAYVSDGGQDGTTPQIWVQQIGGAALRLTNGEREYSHLSFSPDEHAHPVHRHDESGPTCTRCRRSAANRGSFSATRATARFRRTAGGSRASARWHRHPSRGARRRRLSNGRAGDGRHRVHDVVAGQPSRARACASGSRVEPDWWVVPIDGARRSIPVWCGGFAKRGCSPSRRASRGSSTRSCSRRRDRRESISTASASTTSTFQPQGRRERLTTGSESAWLPSAPPADGRVFQQPRRREPLVGRARPGDAASRTARCGG